MPALQAALHAHPEKPPKIALTATRPSPEPARAGLAALGRRNEERRRELTKVAAQYAENARVAVRNVRRDGMDQVKKAKAEGMSEDDQKFWHDAIQELTDKHIGQVDQALEAKQAEIMQV